jgi:hypothetical protein
VRGPIIDCGPSDGFEHRASRGKGVFYLTREVNPFNSCPAARKDNIHAITL